MAYHLLLVEDNPTYARTYYEYLKEENLQIKHVATGQDALKQLSEHVPHLVLLDLRLPDMNGMEILQQITEQKLPTTVIVITAHGSINLAVEAMRLGAYDFLVKPITNERLLVTVRNALERQKLSEIAAFYQEEFGHTQFCGFIGSSTAIRSVYRIIECASHSKASVFIYGASGTGKEICAEAIHQLSNRHDKPFIALNCSAIPRDLIESEIFGHVKGSFTGAINDRQGAASAANGGTLFLDEICEMDIQLQSKLLRFIQTNSFKKVGSNKTEQVDLRFICATNKDPWAEVQAGRFREDLYYRLHVIPIHMPLLSEREADVLLLANYFLARYNQEEGKNFKAFDTETQNTLLHYSWPGNVRQLQNVIRNIVVMNNSDIVTIDMLPLQIQETPAQSLKHSSAHITIPTTTVEALRPLWMVERDAIEHAIQLCDGNIPKAASMLDISPSTIYRKRTVWQVIEKTQSFA